MTTADTDEAALLRAIADRSDDDTPRLVYADWCDDHDRPERAEFIRVQVRLAELGACEVSPEQLRRPDEIGELARRQRALWVVPEAGRWWGEDVFLSLGRSVHERAGLAGQMPAALIRRGFVSEVRLPLAAFVGGECENCGGTGRVDGDRYEQSEPCPDCGGEYGASDEDNPRGVYPGTGRTPGLAAGLFKAHPITRVVLTDREPNDYGPPADDCRFGWLPQDSRIDPGPAVLPKALHRALADTDRGDGILRWPNREEAITALSAACVRYGRGLAGLV